MITKLIHPKEIFLRELEIYIDKGNQLLIQSQKADLTQDEFISLEKEYKLWYDEILEFLKHRFDNPNNEYRKDFRNASEGTVDSFIDIQRGTNPQDIRFRYKYFRGKLEPKIQSLISLTRKLNFIQELNKMSEQSPINDSMEVKKVFISHSSFDSQFVEKIIDTLENIGVPSNQIFCSSFEGYGVKLGADFLEVIKNELNGNVFVLFILSSNFYSSAVSLCEMGATWVKTSSHIPILIPPFEYKDVKGVIPTTHGMKINEKEKYNTLKEIMEDFFELTPIQMNVWERKRDKTLKEIMHLLSNEVGVKNNNKNPEKENISSDNDYYSNLDETIKKQSEQEWPNDFEMQLDYIKNQQNAIEKLKAHNPIDIDKDKFLLIRERARKEWPTDFIMQLDTEQRQVESLRRINKL